MTKQLNLNPLAAAIVGAAKTQAPAPVGLVTGNKGAKKPGKVDRFAITQDEADQFGQMGADFAHAEFLSDMVLAALANSLAPLSGKQDGASIERWSHMRGAFIAGYVEVRGCDDDSARKAWSRAIKPLGLTKPQSPEAAAKAAERAAKRATTTPEGEGSGEDETSPKDGAGDAAAQAVQMGLSRLEAHLIGMLRAGKFAQAAQAVADMAEAAK